MSQRNLSIDNLKTFVIVLVVAVHASFAYCTFVQFDPQNFLQVAAPVVDATRWSGFRVKPSAAACATAAHRLPDTGERRS